MVGIKAHLGAPLVGCNEGSVPPVVK